MTFTALVRESNIPLCDINFLVAVACFFDAHPLTTQRKRVEVCSSLANELAQSMKGRSPRSDGFLQISIVAPVDLLML